jgi:hypothetical protein
MQIQRVQACGEMVDVAVGNDGRVWVLVRRVCDVLGVDFSSQRQKLLTQGWAGEKMRLMSLPDATGTRTQQQAVIDVDALPMWLATIDEARVREDIRPTLVRFQREARDTLAAHFGMRGAQHHASPPAAAGSGGSPPRTGMSSVQGSGGVLELLAITDQLSGAIRATYAEVQAARATAEQAQAIAAEASAMAAETSDTAVGAQTLARLAMQHAERNAGRGIPAHRRRAAVQHITRQMRAHCASRSLDFKDFFGGVRRELGLRPRTDGGPALSKAAMEPHLIILMARYATNKGVAWCTARTIEDILSGADELTRAGYIDIPTSTPKTVQ